MTKPALAIQTEEGRRYVNPLTGVTVPSVTTILDMIPKDLTAWAAKQVAQYVVDSWDEISALMERGDRDHAFTLISGAAERQRQKASNSGDVVHESAEKRIMGIDDGNAPKHMTQLANFFKVSGFRPIHPEVTLWNDLDGYAGTADLIAEDRNGRAVLIDYKTGKSVWPEAAIQLEALARADQIVRPDGQIEVPPSIFTVGVLHLRPQSWWWHPIQDKKVRDSNWKTFLACRDAYEAMGEVRKWKTFHPDMVWGKMGKFNSTSWPAKKAVSG